MLWLKLKHQDKNLKQIHQHKNLKAEEYRQEQYREITKKAKTFYNKYCDILSGGNLFSSSNYNTIKFDSASSAVSATGTSGSILTNYKVNVTQVAEKAYASFDKDDAEIINGKVINIDGKDYTLEGENQTEIAENLTKALSDNGAQIEARYSELANDGQGGVIIERTIEGKNPLTITGITSVKSSDGKDLEATISDGINTYTIKDGKGSDNRTISGNSVTLDGTTFTFNDKTVGEVTLTAKRDGTELKDKIVNFINDYNDLLGSINTKLFEKYDKSYLPLTDEDKEGLSDSEIEKLEKKAQTGLLRNDSYLTEFADDMKLSMTTMIEKSGISLERIGIKPVKDYTAQNGLFTVDEDKLLQAIQENTGDIQELFAGADGIITKLKDNLSEHATGTFSNLAKRAGVEGSVTAQTNEMTKDIEQRKKLITNMQIALKEKEDTLYSRYSILESRLSELQSQQMSLSSYFTAQW
eukprot:TRINITY_DN9991_c0_g1_i3.p1 TRINITY_DN9991_c0_g1~~TRINITY_DN9991_c0_g1_i3.p1  ORF type:complete len:469 (-),score=78.37 TRINITY_DN9991_c0_g1_i3:245-1651(-)